MELWLQVPSELTLLTEVVTVAVNGPMLVEEKKKEKTEEGRSWSPEIDYSKETRCGDEVVVVLCCCAAVAVLWIIILIIAIVQDLAARREPLHLPRQAIMVVKDDIWR